MKGQGGERGVRSNTLLTNNNLRRKISLVILLFLGFGHCVSAHKLSNRGRGCSLGPEPKCLRFRIYVYVYLLFLF